MMRTTKGLEPVHVIYRRVDDEFLDPVHFLADSVLGCPGLVDAARAGNVTLANAIGNGVADDKLVYTYMPDLIRYYLSEDPVIRNVDTWRMGEAEAREEVLDRLDELVLKPVDGSGGKGIVIGPVATRAELDELRAKVLDDPRAWIAQPVVQLSTVPTFVDGRLGARHVDLRPFAVNDGERVWVLPGGLTRVALAEGELIVNSSRGGGSKDTWVLAGPTQVDLEDEDDEPPVVRRPEPEPEPVPVPEPEPEPAAVQQPTHHAPEMPSGPVLREMQSQAEQQQQGRQARGRHAEPDCRVDVLDRSLCRARRGHRSHPRRHHPADPRGLGPSTR